MKMGFFCVLGAGVTLIFSACSVQEIDVQDVKLESAENQEIQASLRAMQDSLEGAMVAVDARDYVMAKKEFKRARQTWYRFGGSLREYSPEAYQSLDEGLRILDSKLNQETPKQLHVLLGLHSISQNIEVNLAN